MSRILVIEDEADLRAGLVTALTFEGYDTLEASDGEQGIDRAKQQRPDLIICDILMPKRSGYGVLVELRHDARTAMIPFIFLTAMSAARDMEDGIQLGADAYITKPFDIAKLMPLVADMLARRQSEPARSLTHIRVGLAHALPPELHAPLTAILGFAGLLAHSGPDALSRPADVQAARLALYHHAHRLQRAMGNVLLYYELRLLQYDPEMRNAWLLPGQETDEATLTGAVRRKAEEFGRGEDVDLHIRDAPFPVSPGLFLKLVEELLDNAFQFSRSGTPVVCEAWRTAEAVTLNVTDRGCGMPGGQKAVPEGAAGRGLAICRLLARLYQGTLALRSHPGEGTTVTVTLYTTTE